MGTKNSPDELAAERPTELSEEAPSKSAAIIEYFQQQPEARNYEVANALNERFGWSISSGYVASVKSQKGLTGSSPKGPTSSSQKGPTSSDRPRRARAKSRPPRKAASRGASAAAPSTQTLDAADVLLAVVEFVERVGGFQQARQALDAVERLRRMS